MHKYVKRILIGGAALTIGNTAWKHPGDFGEGGGDTINQTGMGLHKSGQVVTALAEQQHYIHFNADASIGNSETTTTAAKKAAVQPVVGSTATTAAAVRTIEIAPHGNGCDQPVASVTAQNGDYAILVAQHAGMPHSQSYRVVGGDTMRPEDNVLICGPEA